MSSSIETLANGNGHAGEHDHVLRPRPRKPKHSQVSDVVRMTSTSDGEHLMPDNASTGSASGLTRYGERSQTLRKANCIQRSFYTRPRECASIRQVPFHRSKTSSRRATPPYIPHDRVRLTRESLRPRERLQRLPWLLQLVLDWSCHYGYYIHAAQS